MTHKTAFLTHILSHLELLKPSDPHQKNNWGFTMDQEVPIPLSWPKQQKKDIGHQNSSRNDRLLAENLDCVHEIRSIAM